MGSLAEAQRASSAARASRRFWSADTRCTRSVQKNRSRATAVSCGMQRICWKKGQRQGFVRKYGRRTSCTSRGTWTRKITRPRRKTSGGWKRRVRSYAHFERAAARELCLQERAWNTTGRYRRGHLLGKDNPGGP